jgi:hypothetical protein
MMEREERQQHVPQQTVKLSPFWPQAPALWFAQAEGSFTVKKTEAQYDRYCHVVAALPHESLRLVADLVESPPTETPMMISRLGSWLLISSPISRRQRNSFSCLRWAAGSPRR